MSTFWAADFNIAATRAIALCVNVGAFVLIHVAFANGVRLRPLLNGVMLGASTNAIIAIYQFYTDEAVRVAGLAGNANLFAMQLAIAGALSLSLLKPDRRWPILFALAMLTIATVLSGSRKVTFAWVILLSLLLGALWSTIRRSRFAFGAALVAGPGVAFGSLALGATLLPYVQDLHVFYRFGLFFQGVDRSGNDRIGMIRDGLDLWAASPLWGHGIDQFRVLTPWGLYSHNNYIEILATLGLVGLLLYCSMYFIVLRRAALQSTHGPLVVALVFTLLVWDLAAVSFSVRSHWLFLNAIAFLATRPAKDAALKESERGRIGPHWPRRPQRHLVQF